MRPIIRNLFAAGMVMSVCAFASADAQGKSQKDKSVKHDDHSTVTHKQHVTQKSKQTAKRTYTRARVLCADGVWVTRVTNACINRGGLAARQGDYATTPRASDRARERASINSAVRRNSTPYANNTSTNAIARCMDGTYWHSTTRTNACYRHGGVARWL